MGRALEGDRRRVRVDGHHRHRHDAPVRGEVMGQPFPPQGNQKQHTERPTKIYAEQYLLTAPLPIGVSTNGPTGESVPPYVVAGGIYSPVRETDWVISSRYTGAVVEVISHEEFTERFGNAADE